MFSFPTFQCFVFLLHYGLTPRLDDDENWLSALSVARPGTFDYRLHWTENGERKTGAVGHFSVPPKLEVNGTVWRERQLIECAGNWSEFLFFQFSFCFNFSS
jgi:hypothetical protein